MVKKKASEQKEKEQNESADNKADNNINGNNDTTYAGKSEGHSTDELNAGESESDSSSTDKVVDREGSLEEKLAEMQDKYLRLSAEFDNYRKRTLREKMELTKYGGENVLIKILPFLDDLERAVSHMESARDITAMKEGMDLIHGKFIEFLKQNGVREIETMNYPFNVDLHDAVSKINVEEEDKKGKVIDVIQKGYYLQDKIIRHSKVVVGV